MTLPFGILSGGGIGHSIFASVCNPLDNFGTVVGENPTVYCYLNACLT